MSAETDDEPGETPAPTTITLRRGEGLDLWVAEDHETGVVSQGPTREAALENLDEAVAGYYGAGDAPTADELDAMGIDPDANSTDGTDESDVFDL